MQCANIVKLIWQLFTVIVLNAAGKLIGMEHLTDSTCPDNFCRARDQITGYCKSNVCLAIAKKEPCMPESLTKAGYSQIIERILNMTVTPPDSITVRDLQHWIEGYIKAQTDILEIVNKMRDTYGR